MARRNVMRAVVGAVVAVAGFAMPAMAQNALDRNMQLDNQGRRLRFNPQLDGRGRSAAAQREAIVFGTAANGLSFRGSVDGTVSRDFRGSLGSDDLFAFRRDSLSSGVSGLGVRGTEALQVTFGLTGSNTFDPTFAGVAGIDRQQGFTPIRGVNTVSTTNISQLSIDSGQLSVGRPSQPNGFGIDRDTGPTRIDVSSPGGYEAAGDTSGIADLSRSFVMRSTSGFVTTRALAGQDLGQLQSPDGSRYGYTASSLTGIDRRTIEESGEDLRPTAIAPNRVDNKIEVVFADLAPRYETAIKTGPNALDVGQPAEPGETEGDAALGLKNDLIRFLATPTDPLGETADEDGPLGFGFERDEDVEGEAEADSGLPGLKLEDPDAEPEVLTERERLIQKLRAVGVSEGALRLLSEQQIFVERLTGQTPPTEDELFAVHIGAAERLMQEQRYFEAEARYTVALSAKPGDPVAAVGRVHASLGAGLYTSAAVNLREVLTRHPDLIPVRYGKATLPSASRIDRAIKLLGERLEDPANPDAAVLGGLLAYVGYQAGNEQAVRDGLAVIPEDDGLGLLLELQWLPQSPDTESDTDSDDGPDDGGTSP